MLNALRKKGLSSRVMYAMGFGSIGLTVVSWMASKKMEAAGVDRADRWGLFIGEWAPTFFALGTAMRLEEQWGDTGPHEAMAHMKDTVKDKARDAVPTG
ncbi:hypothetical protein [Actinomadura hibisca]|uniref:hypothetical protein n=1 Tax=Actinomadura hibisca TaxID=68565 RepID=UPI0008341F2D|nr:hypothetical protein [Actinomadura hibisca]